MGRVIKGGAGGAGQKGPPARPPTRVAVDMGKRVIGREVYQAKQAAEELLARAELERTRMLEQARRQAAQLREEAMSRGAAEAFAQAATEALLAFRRRAQRYADAADDIRFLAREVVRKVLGTDSDLSAQDVERILQQGMSQLRARRRLRVQVPEARLKALAQERPNLMKTLKDEPDLVIEAATDVSTGFARVVTEVGGALCAEETALNSLADAVNVHEQPNLAPRRESAERRRFENRTEDGSGEGSSGSRAPAAVSMVDEEAEDVDDDDLELSADAPPAVSVESSEDDDGALLSVDPGDLASAARVYPAAAGPDDETETFGLDRAQLRAIVRRRKGASIDDGEVFRSGSRTAARPPRARLADNSSDPNATMTIALSDIQAAEPSLAFSDLPDLPVAPVDDDELELFTDTQVPSPPQKKKK
jgi:flagellar biosynthesis/type III secretory pathway protein FliH